MWSSSTRISRRPPEKPVFGAYVALSDRMPEKALKWFDTATLDTASVDLHSAPTAASSTVRGHAMAASLPGFRSNAGLKVLREHDGAILFAHSDLSGFSVFEEAACWGCRATRLAAR